MTRIIILCVAIIGLPSAMCADEAGPRMNKCLFLEKHEGVFLVMMEMADGMRLIPGGGFGIEVVKDQSIIFSALIQPKESEGRVIGFFYISKELILNMAVTAAIQFKGSSHFLTITAIKDENNELVPKIVIEPDE